MKSSLTMKNICILADSKCFSGQDENPAKIHSADQMIGNYHTVFCERLLPGNLILLLSMPHFFIFMAPHIHTMHIKHHTTDFFLAVSCTTVATVALHLTVRIMLVQRCLCSSLAFQNLGLTYPGDGEDAWTQKVGEFRTKTGSEAVARQNLCSQDFQEASARSTAT